MRVHFIVLILGLLTASTSGAADAVAYGPPPAWLKPVVVPKGDGDRADAPAKVLMRSYQLRFSPGGMESYVESYVRVQTPQGLQGLGNLALPWKPETDLLTVHHCELLRDGKVIDLISSGQKFEVVRRENNLEYAALDGMLTAVLQPNGMEVGDVLRLAYSVKRESSLLPAPEALLAEFASGPLARVEVHASWDSGTPMRWQVSEEVKDARQTRVGKEIEFSWAADNLEPITQPINVPGRFWRYPLIEFTGYGSWSEISRLLAPLYSRATALSADSSIKTEARAIAQASAETEARLEAALKLVQERVRYVFLGMGDGNLNPASADLTWQRRFGDCKGKSALLIALLRELGIDAEPVLVATSGGDSIALRLPMVAAFDHVIVRARSGNRSWWLDGTGSGSWHRDDMGTPNYYWGLPLSARGQPLLRMVAEPAAQPFAVISTKIDAREGLYTDAPFSSEMRLRGTTAAATQGWLAQLSPSQREQGLRDYWKNAYGFVQVKVVNSEFDAAAGVLIMRMEGTADMDWSGFKYTTDGLNAGANLDYSREPGINKDAPFVVEHPQYRVTRQTIQLPGVGNFKTEGADYDVTLAGLHYRRQSKIEDGVFNGELRVRSLLPEITASEARAAQKQLNAMWMDRLQIRASNYQPTDADVAALRTRKYTHRADLIWRGNIFMARSDYDAAFTDFDAAVKADARSAAALANRGIALYWKRNEAAAKADFEAALAIDANSVLALQGLGSVLRAQGDNQGAVEKTSAALRLDPENTTALTDRAFAYSSLGRHEEALADAAQSIKLFPRGSGMYDLRAWIFALQGEVAKALEEIDKMYAANPDENSTDWFAAQRYAHLGHYEKAVRAMDRLIARQPDAANYLWRSGVRDPDDYAGRLADIDTAIKLDPASRGAALRRAQVLSESGDHRGSLEIYTAQIRQSTDAAAQRALRASRAVEYIKLGELASARKDLAAALDGVTDADTFNNFCWTLATARVELAAALAACDKALAISPEDSASLDSRGFVLLQLGRWDEAIAAYDAALARRPNAATSLYGRGIAKQRRCQCGDGNADMTAAERRDDGVKRLFARAGLSP